MIAIHICTQMHLWQSYILKRVFLRSSHEKCSVRKGILSNFGIFIGKNLCQSLFYNKVAGLACNIIKKEALAQAFPVNFAKLLITLILHNISGRMLLYFCEVFCSNVDHFKITKTQNQQSVYCSSFFICSPCFYLQRHMFELVFSSISLNFD